jgi:uncharacterized protein (TIGR02466 family)
VSEILTLFPTGVLKGTLGRSVTKTEIDFLYGLDKNNNIGNKISSNKYILNEKSLSKLQQDLYKVVYEYVNEIITASEEIDFVITQSWITYTEKDEYHHTHRHPNSYISGILYIDTVETDSITFFNPFASQIEVIPKTYNVFNSKIWSIPTETGDVIIFPSHIDHMVQKRICGDSTRTSLSFNIMPRGSIGGFEEVCELVL